MAKAEATKAWIIEKTAPVFNKKGFMGTTLSDMETATGLTKGSIYNNFGNKDDVALAVFDHNLTKVNDLIQAEMSKYQSAREQLMVYVNVYGNTTLKSNFPEGGCPVLNTSVDSDDTHPELRKKANAAVIAWKNRIIGLIEKGMQDKEFVAHVQAEEVALGMIATIEGAIMIGKVTGKPGYLQAALKTVEHTIESLRR